MLYFSGYGAVGSYQINRLIQRETPSMLTAIMLQRCAKWTSHAHPFLHLETMCSTQETMATDPTSSSGTQKEKYQDYERRNNRPLPSPLTFARKVSPHK